MITIIVELNILCFRKSLLRDGAIEGCRDLVTFKRQGQILAASPWHRLLLAMLCPSHTFKCYCVKTWASFDKSWALKKLIKSFPFEGASACVGVCLCALERQKESIFLHISSTLRASGETKAGLGTAAPFLNGFSSARQSVGFFLFFFRNASFGQDWKDTRKDTWCLGFQSEKTFLNLSSV